MIRYFLYARKSIDDDDRQVLSIDAQLRELHEFASKEKLVIVEEFIEARTAKVPGRPIFNAMLARIQQGEANGIISWHPDRLARNSIDGGQIIYLLDTEQLKSLKCPTFWFENTPQGKFMLNIAFGQSKYYIDNMRENVLRGIREKLRRGEFPGKPPVGYLNDLRRHNIVIDPEKAPLVMQMFETFATGQYSVSGLRRLISHWGLCTAIGKPFAPGHMWNLLSNPFYIGLMRFQGEIHQGSHDPLISKELFDKVQALLRDRGKPRRLERPAFPFLGLLHCQECGCSITAEEQKGHHYYRCTKKRGKCSQPFIREEMLAIELRDIVSQATLPEGWATPIFAEIDTWKCEEATKSNNDKLELKEELAQINTKLERLLDAHLDGVATRDEYLPRKERLLHQKTEVTERLAKVSAKSNYWLEPMRHFFQASIDAGSVAHDANLAEIAAFLKTTGSNLTLKDRKAHCEWVKPWSLAVNRLQFPNWRAREESNLQPWA